MKTQTIRLLDVFFVGPLMVYAADKLPKEQETAAKLLAVVGVATVLYNGRNFILTNRETDGGKEV